MFIGLVFTLGFIIITAESKCTNIIRRLSSQCGINMDGGVCCDYLNNTMVNYPGNNAEGKIYFLAPAHHTCAEAGGAVGPSDGDECRATISQLRKMDQRVNWSGELSALQGKSAPGGCTVAFSGSSENTLNYLQWNGHNHDKTSANRKAICISEKTCNKDTAKNCPGNRRFYPDWRYWPETCDKGKCTNLRTIWCKTYEGDFCYFPFTYEGKTYDRCITGRTYYWCGRDKYTQTWGECKDEWASGCYYKHPNERRRRRR